jgi:hypothetical protein
VQGDVVFWDLRGQAPVRAMEVHRSPMTALAVHGHAPLFAWGSHNQFIKVFDFNGNCLNTIRYHDGFLGQVSRAVAHATSLRCCCTALAPRAPALAALRSLTTLFPRLSRPLSRSASGPCRASPSTRPSRCLRRARRTRS